MQVRMAESVKDGEEDEASCTDDGPEACSDAHPLLIRRGVVRESALVPQPPLREESQVAVSIAYIASVRVDSGLERKGV